MSAETIALIALGITILGNLATLLEKVFGGGNKLAARFSTLKESTTQTITELRLEFIEKNERNNSNSKVGFEAITANIHALQLGFSDFRAQMAENYMRRDSYYKASEELKQDFKAKHDDLKAEMHQGFSDVKDQIGAVAQSIELGRKQTRSHT